MIVAYISQNHLVKVRNFANFSLNYVILRKNFFGGNAVGNTKSLGIASKLVQ